MPALAVADALRERGAEVRFVGARGAGAAGAVGSAGYAQDLIPLRGLARRVTPRNLTALVMAGLAVPRAMGVLARRRPDVVLGAGGYVAGPVALAAWLTRRPLMLMEADSHLGVANRLAAPLARRVALAFPLPGRTGRRYLVTGRPVSRAVRSATRTAGRRAFGIDPGATAVLVVGGSQGARSLNRAAVRGVRRRPRRSRSSTSPARACWRRPAACWTATRPGTATGWWAGWTTCRGRSPPPTWWSPARAARSSSSPRSGGPRSWCRTRTPPPTTRPRTPAGSPRRAPRSCCPTTSAPASACAAWWARCCRTRTAWTAMGEAALAAGRPDAADRVAEEVLAIARRPRRRLLRRPRVPRPRLPRLRRRRPA